MIGIIPNCSSRRIVTRGQKKGMRPFFIFFLKGWDFSIETGSWASKLGFEGGGTEKEEEKIPHMCESIGHLDASHTKIWEYPFIPLMHYGGTKIIKMSVFLFL